MVYTPTVWKDRDVQNPRTYSVRENEDGTVTLFDAPGEIYEQGTPVNAANLNKIEEELTKKGGGLEIGDIGFAAFGINETLNERRYLNGQVISQSQFEAFTKMIKERAVLYPSLVASETNWQAEVTNSKLGQCGKFVIDDTLGTIRLPKVVNINGLQNLALIGSIKTESLPNITGSLDGLRGGNTDSAYTGVFSKGTSSSRPAQAGSGDSQAMFNASRSSSTYQDNAPVQQEAIQYPYFIQVATGTEESVDVTREIELNNPFFLGMSQYFESEPKNASWLISNGSFHSGATYVSFYEWLLKIYNGTETVEGVSVKASTDTYDDYDYVINTADTTFRLPLLNGEETLIDYAAGEEKSHNTPYTAEKNGWLRFGGDVADKRVEINGGHALRIYGSNSFYMVVGCPVTKGQEYIWRGGSVGNLTFFPYKGNGSLYFYVGETIQDANVIAASQVLTKVANCIDRTVKSDKETVVGWGMPDYSSGISVSNGTYTPPCDGIIKTAGTNKGATVKIKFGNIMISECYVNGGYPTYSVDTTPVSKNETYTIIISGSAAAGEQEMCVFYPLKGVN